METHSSILAWRIPWTEEPGSYSPEGCTESDGKESTCNTGDPGLKKVMETHSSILAWRIPWTEGPGSYSPEGCTESDMTEATQHAHMYPCKFIGRTDAEAETPILWLPDWKN